jgi:hypothetical protein
MDMLTYNAVENLQGVVRNYIAGQDMSIKDVGYVNNGTVYKNKDYSPETNVFSDSGGASAVFQIDSTRFLCLSCLGNSAGIAARVLSVNTDSLAVTAGTSYTAVGSSNPCSNPYLFQMDASTYVACWTNTNNNCGYAIMLNVSGTTVTLRKTPIQATTITLAPTPITFCQLNATTYMAHSYNTTDAASKGWVRVFTTNGFEFNVGSDFQYTSNCAAWGTIYVIDENHVLACGGNYNVTNGSTMTATVLSITGLNVTAGSTLSIGSMSSMSDYYICSYAYKVNASTFIVNFNGYVVVLTLNGTTITAGAALLTVSMPQPFKNILYIPAIGQYVGIAMYSSNVIIVHMRLSGTNITLAASSTSISDSTFENVSSLIFATTDDSSTKCLFCAVPYYGAVNPGLYCYLYDVSNNTILSTMIYFKTAYISSDTNSLNIFLLNSTALFGSFPLGNFGNCSFIATFHDYFEGSSRRNHGVVLNSAHKGETVQLLCQGISKGALSGLSAGAYYVNKLGALYDYSLVNDSQIVPSFSAKADLEADIKQAYAVALDDDELLILEPFNKRGVL